MTIKSHGQVERLFKVTESTFSECQKKPQEFRKLKNRISQYQFTNDTLTLELSLVLNCCLNPEEDFYYKNDTLFISYQNLGNYEPCACNCCFSFSHKIIGIDTQKLTIFYDQKELEKSDEIYLTFDETYEIHNSDTFNLKDKYGLEQGIWCSPNSNFFTSWKDGKPIGHGYLYKNMKVKSETIEGQYFEYYKSGKLKLKCRIDENDKHFDCAEYNKFGKQKK